MEELKVLKKLMEDYASGAKISQSVCHNNDDIKEENFYRGLRAGYEVAIQEIEYLIKG